MPEKKIKPILKTKTVDAAHIDYRQLFNSLPDQYLAFYLDDPDFTIAAESQAHATNTMVKPGEAIGKPVFDVFPDTSDKYISTGVSDFKESLRKVIRTGKPDVMDTLQYDLRRPDGTMETRFWQLTHYPLFDSANKLALLVQSTHDITKEVTAGNKLLRAEQRLDEALEVGQIATWSWNIASNKIIGDRNLALLFGISELDAARGMPLPVFLNAVHDDDKERVTKEIADVLKSGDNYVSEYRTITRTGIIRWVIVRGRIERNAKGEPINFPGALVDITERKTVENNLTYLAKASAVLSESLDYRKTLQTIAQLMVPDFADWCGVEILDENNVLQQVVVAHKDPEKVRWAQELRQKQGPPNLEESSGTANVLRTGKPEFYPHISDELIVASAKDKKELKLLRDLALSSVIIVPLKMNNKPVGVISLIATGGKRDFTESDLEMAEALATRASLAMTNAALYDDAQRELAERTRLEEALRAANEELESRVEERTSELAAANRGLQRSNQELQDFAYVASHDLQEPLRKIQAFGNLLQTEYSAVLGEGSDYLDRMRNAAARMSALIEDILSFSRVSTKGREFAPVNLKTIAQEVVGDLEIRIQDTGAVVDIGDLPTIHADPMQMRQLLQNLIANAIKFHREDAAPVIKLRASIVTPSDGKIKYCRLEIEDNGLGFDEKYLDRIFAVFQRLHNRDSYEGTGIGLAVCRKIVERHGGTITATSRLGKGSTFIILLPMRHKKGENLV
jgi:PAS domain S-box-containing protein